MDEGNYVQTSDTAGLVVVAQIDPMTVIFTVTEDDISKVTARLTGGAVLPVTAYDRTNSTEITQGKLGSVDNQVDTTTGTVKLRAVFDNRDAKLFPQQFVNAKLLVDTLHDAITRPDCRHPNGCAGVVRLCGEFRFYGLSSRDQAGTNRWRASRGPFWT